MSTPEPLEVVPPQVAGVDQTVSDLLKKWRLEDAVPTVVVSPVGQRSGNGVAGILRYLLSNRGAPSA